MYPYFTGKENRISERLGVLPRVTQLATSKGNSKPDRLAMKPVFLLPTGWSVVSKIKIFGIY